MFSFTESFHNRDSTMPHDPNDPPSPPAVSVPGSPSSTNNPHSPPTPHTPHRNSSYLPEKDTTPVSPDSTIISDRAPSPGLEPVRSDDETLKEAAATPYFDPPDKEFYEQPKKEDGYTASATGPAYGGKKRRPWLKWVIAGVVLVVILAIALGVGLGVGLKKNKSKPQSKDRFLSTVGAFNGSGIALASQSFDGTAFGSIVMYFQHHTGQIRSAQLNSEGEWKGGDATEVVAVDAKNGTPIAAVAYARNETARWHIFYINTNGTISEVINSNRTNVWAPGPLNKLGLTPLADPNVGLQACWYGSFYSDVQYKHSPVPGQDSSNYNNTDLTVGIHLWYGSGDDTFGSASWIYGDTVWTKQQDFGGYNPHGGVGCYSWGPGSVTYVFMVDKEDQLNILWKDLNITHKETQAHPVHEWVKSDVRIPVYQNSSVGFTNYLYVQNRDLSFSGFNISWDAEKTAVPTDPDQQFVVGGAKGLPGSHLSVTALPDKSGGDSLLAFYQTNGSDITEFVRDFERGQWTSSAVPIPDG